MSFQPFVVQCLTCGSQLRVTDPAIVGTIASCPKCNSMVQIDRPGNQIAVGGSNIDSQAITEEAIATNEATEFGSAAPTASGFVGDEARAPIPSETAPIPPPWQSDRTRKSRQIALVVAVSVTGLVIAIAGFIWFVQYSQRGKTSAQAADPSAESQLVDGNLPVEPETVSDVAVDPATEGTSSEAEPIPPDPEQQAAPSSGQDSGNPSPQDQASQATVDQQSSTSNNADTKPSDPGTNDAANRDVLPSDLIPRSPLDPQPPQVPAPPPPEVPSASATDPGLDNGGMEELPPELAKYTRFLLEEGSTEKPNLEAPPTMDDVTIEAAVEELDDPTIMVRPKEVNLKADLAVRMAIDTKGYPLPDLVLLISQITGVPIQIDWVSFDLAGIDLEAPVGTLQGWQTARAILDAVAAGLGAELREEETLVIITLTDEGFDQHLAALADLSDFGDGQASAKQVLVDFLRSEGNEANDELQLGLSREDHQISAIAIDALRRMRGITPKVADDRMHRWAWCSNDPTGEWKLLIGGEPIAQPDTPIAMADFLRRMARKNGVSNLINWYDFDRRAVAPERLLLPHVEGDAGATLERVLKPLGLQGRQVDANHWWFGRESTYDRLPVLVWTPPLGESQDRFVAELSNVMADASRDAFRITVDPQSERALMLLPRFVVRQLAKLADGIAAK